MMDGINSPCIGICTMDRNSGVCIGCGRTLDEIGNWSNIDNIKKKQVLENLNAKKEKYKKFK